MESVDRRVWVGCLACYNGGDLVGEWLEPSEGPRWECPQGGGDHEETWVLDHEGFGSALGGECSPQLAADRDAALFYAEVVGDPGQIDAMIEWLGESNVDWDALRGQFEGSFNGEYESFRAFADEMAVECGPLMGMGTSKGSEQLAQLVRYFDWDAWARDLRYGYHGVSMPDGGVCVFRQG